MTDDATEDPLDALLARGVELMPYAEADDLVRQAWDAVVERRPEGAFGPLGALLIRTEGTDRVLVVVDLALDLMNASTLRHLLEHQVAVALDYPEPAWIGEPGSDTTWLPIHVRPA